VHGPASGDVDGQSKKGKEKLLRSLYKRCMVTPRRTQGTALQQVLWLVALAVLYYALARVARLLTLPPHNISVFWPPNGVVLGIMLLVQRWRWRPILVGIMLGQLVLNWVDAQPLLLTVAFTTANIAEIWIGAVLVQRFSGPVVSLRRLKEVVYLVLFSSVVACGVSGTIGILAVMQVVKETAFFNAWGVWMIADGMSTLIITPVLLTWVPHEGAPWEPLGKQRAVEAIVLFVLLALMSEIIFGSLNAIAQVRIPIMYSVFPFVLWAAVRLGPRGASGASLIIALIAVGNASLGRGPKFFGPNAAASAALWLQIYLAVVVLSGLFLAAVWSERTQTEEMLRKEREYSTHIVSTAPAMICGLGPGGAVVSVNPAVTKAMGYTPEEISGKSLWELLCPGDLAVQVEPARAALRGDAGSYEMMLQAKDGSRRTVAWSAVSRSDGEAGAADLILIGNDITARKQAEDALKHTLEELEVRVQKRTQAFVEANATLEAEIEERRRAEEIISRQAKALFELSTPIVKIRHDMELVPLIGTLDSRRAQQLMEHVLERISRDSSSVVLIDVTGVLAIEQETAHYLIKTITAVRLLGAEAVLTGVRPAIARALVDHGIDLAGIETQSSLAVALDARLGRKAEPRGRG
jgi:PAS domain S-box-containing protein